TGAEWRLWFQDKRATGFFFRCNAQHQMRAGDPNLKITLARVSNGFDSGLDLHNPDKAPDKAYYDLLLDFPLRSGPQTMVKREAGYLVQRDKRFKVALPRLTHFPDGKVMNRVNLDLAQKFARARLDAASCLQGMNFRAGTWDEERRVAAFSEVVLSIVRETSYYCGGAHPDGTTEAFVYDMRTGSVLDLKDYFKAQDTSAILEDGEVPDGPTHDLLI